jgi:hypothetical protein
MSSILVHVQAWTPYGTSIGGPYLEARPGLGHDFQAGEVENRALWPLRSGQRQGIQVGCRSHIALPVDFGHDIFQQ